MRSVHVEYRNPQNKILSGGRHRDFVPVKGGYMTRLESSSRTVWEIIHVNDDADDVLVRECKVKPVDGTLPLGHQSWSIAPDPAGTVVRVSLRKDGKWHQWRRLTSIFIPEAKYYYAWV